MADENETQEPTEESPSGGHALRNMLIYAFIAILAGGGGFAVPLLFPNLVGGSTPVPGQQAPARVTFVPFGEIVVNLDEDRLNRYLRVSITLQLDEPFREEAEKLVEKNRAILKSWLLSYLSDKGMDEIRGAAGQNRLRREIQDKFNSVLYPDGVDRIQDILFEEFNVQ